MSLRIRSFIRDKIFAALERSSYGFLFISNNLNNNGIYALKILHDHSIAFHYGDTVGRKIKKYGDFNRRDVKEIIQALKRHGKHLTDLDVLEIGANIGSQLFTFCSTQIAVISSPWSPIRRTWLFSDST